MIIFPEMVAPLSLVDEIPEPATEESITLFEYTSFDKSYAPELELAIPVARNRTILQLEMVMLPSGLELVPPLPELMETHLSALGT